MNPNSQQLEAQLVKIKALESNLTFRISIVNKILEQQATTILADAPVGLTGYRVLKIVETFDALSISDISRHMMTDRAQVSRTAVELGHLGLVAFHADDISKRKKIVVLSRKGVTLVRKLTPRFDKRVDDIAALLGDNALAGLWDAIDKLSTLRPR